MRRPSDRRTASRLRCLAVSACAVPLLAACSGAAAQVQLPPKPGAPAPAAVESPAPMTPRQQVTAALTGYTVALARAEASRDASQARQLLRPYLVPGRIGGLVATVRMIWDRGETFYGQDQLHLVTVRISARRAWVHECDDTSGMGLNYVATGQAVPGSAGANRVNLITSLDLVRGRWLVATQLPEDLPCVP